VSWNWNNGASVVGAQPPVPAEALEMRSTRRGEPQPDFLDYVLFLPSIWLTCSLAISVRLIGPLFVVIPVGVCIIYGVLRRTVPPRLLGAYLGFCLFIAILSHVRLLPTSWQIHFMQEAIVRQLVPVMAFFAVAWASKAYFRRRLLCGDIFFGAPIFLFLSLVVAPAVMFQQGLKYQGEDSAHAMIALYGAFINNILIAMFFITGFVFLSTDWRRYAGLIVLFAIAVMTHFLQFRILTAVALATLLGVPARMAAIGLVVTMTGVYAIGINYVPEMMISNPNSGIRLAFVADALSSAVDTRGIGIGFGTESVRAQYQFAGMKDFSFMPDPRSITPERMLELLSTGVHNSFAQALLRTGLPGFLLLFAAFFAAFPARNLPQGVQNHAAVIFGMIFIACFVNPALETPVVVVGVGFVYGYLLALRAWAQARAPAAAVGLVRSGPGISVFAGGPA
jgi:O-antigen ligase